MDEEGIKNRIYARVDELPTLPAVVPKLLSLMENPDSDITEVTYAISQDPALASKILKAANSAYYGFPKGIADLDRAVTLLGFNMVKSLALSIGVIKCLWKGKLSPNFSHRELWLHSVTVATGMKKIGDQYCSRMASGHIFIIGLLHDMGKLVLDQFFTNAFQEILEMVTRTGTVQSLAEKRILGFDHGEIGAMVLHRWNFPDEIVEPIHQHHQKGFPQERAPEIIAALRIADALSQDMERSEGARPLLEDYCHDLKALSIDEKALEGLGNDLIDAREGIEALLGVIM